MSVKGYYNFDVNVVGIDGNGNRASEMRKVQFDMFFLIHNGLNPHERSIAAKEGAVELVGKAHPSWKSLSVESCVEV